MKGGLFTTRRGFIRLCLLAGLGLLGARGFVNSRDPEVRKVEVPLKRLPAPFDGLTIGQITDIHAGPLVPRELVRKGVDLILEKRPDLIVLTGDFVSGATRFLWTTYGGFKERHYDYCMKELARLNAPMGVFAVLGNHDFWSGPEVARKVARGLGTIGVRVLRNEAVPLEKQGGVLYIVGVDDYWESSYSLAEAIQGVRKDSCRILLSHNPDVNEDIDSLKERVDLVVSGHTHGGQIVVPFVGAPYIPSPFGQKYRAGLVEDGERKTYISCGLGLFFVPVRLNCPADVSIMTLRRA